MDTRSATLLCARVLMAFAIAVSAHAQTPVHAQAMLPVVDADSGQIQAWLLLEPEALPHSPPHTGAGARANNALVNRLGQRFGLRIGDHHGSLPAWLAHNEHSSRNDLDINDLTVFARKPISTETYLSIAGTMTRATLLPYAAAPADIGRTWNSKSLAVGGGYGAFSANIIGQVVDSPGQPRWENLGLGVTWRTPWSGQLTVGADNIITSGRNPFSPRGETRDEGTVPYVRYEQEF